MENNENILEIKNLNKVFPQKGSLLVAVDNANFNLKRGETIGLIGESGSGKTTIGRTIIRLHKPTSGQILIEGVDVAAAKLSKDENLKLRENIQMIFQDPYSSLNEQKNIMSIVSEPIKILKLDRKYMKDLFENSDKVYKFFGFSLEDYFYERIFKFRNFANKIAISDHEKILKDLNEVQLNKSSKIENIKHLLSLYFSTKIEGNDSIINRMLSIPEEIFNVWKDYQQKVKEGKLDLELEKTLLKATEAYESAQKRSKYSKKYVDLKKEIELIENEVKKFKDYYNAKKRSSVKNIKNINAEWNNAKKIKLEKAKRTETNGEYNFIYLDYLIAKEMEVAIKKVISQNMMVNEGFIEKFQKLYESLKFRLFDKFEEVKKIEKKSIRTIYKNIVEIDSNIENIVLEFISQNTIANDKCSEYIYNHFLSDASVLKIESFKKLEDLLNKQKEKLALEKESVNDLVSDEELARLKAEYDAAVKADEDDLKIFVQEHAQKISELQANRKQILKEQNESIDNYRVKAKELLYKKIDEVYAKKIENFPEYSLIKSEKELKKWLADEIKKNDSINESVNQEIKRIYRDLKIIEDFITNKLKSKSKIKKMLVRNRVFKALEDSGLTKAHAYRYPHEFSGGMRQRVGIARAIIAEPKIIIADEPIAALDLSIQAQIVNMLKGLQKRDNMSMIFIAHDLSMVKYISDKILIIHLGKIVESGLTHEIFENPIHPYTKNLIDSMPDIARISQGFENNNFEPTYLEKYTSLNVPKYFEISKTHKVLADEEQIKEWK